MLVPGESLTFAVVPVLVGPLQALLALLPALLFGLGAFLAALCTPRGLRQAGRFLWRQKLFSLLLLCVIVSLATGWPWQRLARGSRFSGGGDWSGEWPSFRGGPERRGAGPDDLDPEVPITLWNYDTDPAVYSSPAVVGDTVVVSTAADISPFNPTGRGAIVALDVRTGKERWRYAPEDYRATFSSPVVAEGAVVCGEGLHQVQDARVTCLELDGRLRWEFRTASHVESTPAIADGRVFVGAGADGFYALDLRGDGAGGPKVLWHLSGEHFPDCESSPLVIGDVVIFGLGEGGQAICGASVADGQPLWRISTPYPVFTAPTRLTSDGESGPRLAVAMGNGNFVQSAEEIRRQRLEALRESGASEETIDEARRALAPGGQVWCVELATGKIEWRYLLDDTVLGSIAERDGRLYFGCRDGSVHCLDRTGTVLRRFELHAPIVCSPALGRTRAYFTTSLGRLFALDLDTLRPTWDASLGDGEGFTSSPVVTQGHLLVGTQRQGLTCLGTTTGRLRGEIWRRGELGGAADQESPATEAQVVGHWPPDDERFEVTAPLSIAEGQLLAVGRMRDGERMVRLEFDASGARVAWQAPAAIMDFHPPLSIGGHIYSLEYFNQLGRPDSHFDPSRPTITWPHVVARHVETGQLLWRNALRPVQLKGWTGDRRHLYLAGVDRIMTFDTKDGFPGWTAYFGTDKEVTLALADDVVLASDGEAWRALDAGTGIELWRRAADGAQTGVLDANSTQFLAVTRDENGASTIQLRQVLDGALVWQVPWLDEQEVSWGRLALDHALVGAPSGRWRTVRLADGSFVELDSDIVPDESARNVARRGTASVLLFRSHAVDHVTSGLRLFGIDDDSSRAWLDAAEFGQTTTPLVASRGRVYFGTDRGKILCVGPRGAGP